jgi:HlyD family secretion protein
LNAGRSSGDSGYRTSTVGNQSIDQDLARVGTIEPVSQAEVAFPVSGTVASVGVKVGDKVTVGQELAKLDIDDLEAALVQKQAALDDAELTLEKALNGESVGSPSGSPASVEGVAYVTSAVDTGGSPASVAAVSLASANVTDDELAAAQQAVLAAQEQVDSDLGKSQQALDDAAAVCASVGQTASMSTSTSSSTTSSSSTSSTTQADDSDDSDVAACRDALDAVLAAQQTVSADQATVTKAASALDALLDEWADDLKDQAANGSGNGPSGGTGGTDSGSPDGSTGSGISGGATGSESPSGSGSGDLGSASGGQGGSATSSSPSSADLIAYQKAVDAAEADVAVAEQAVSQARVVSPISGTVQEVSLAVGDSVSAGDTETRIVVVGDGGYEVSTTVTVDDLPDVEVGQEATITPDGSEDAVIGEVVSIGVGGSTSGSSTTYPVVIGLSKASDDLHNGASADLVIVTDSAGDALAVPTSAVTTEDDRSTVTVLEDGKTSQVDVKLGVVGDEWTEITDGLKAGQTVVLADLDEPLPSSATDSSNGNNDNGPDGFGGGRFPGGNFPSGNFPGR